MGRERIRDLDDAKDLRGDTVGEMYATPDRKVGPATAHGVSGAGMHGIEVDLDELLAADLELARLEGELRDQLRDAARFTRELKDGSSPVATAMRKAFLRRADPEEGVQAVLEDYLRELTNVRIAIRETLTAYQGVDTGAAALMSRQETNG